MRDLTHKSASTVLKSVWVLQTHWQTSASSINARLKGQLQAVIYDVCLSLEGVSSTFLKQAILPPQANVSSVRETALCFKKSEMPQ